jgi:hypothetical protein
MCGLSGDDARDLFRKVRASRAITKQPEASDRFEIYATGDSLIQWVFTKKSEPAYPAITCRRMYQEANGSWHQTRNMRCDASREACDRLFSEFQSLDEQMRQQLVERTAGSR